MKRYGELKQWKNGERHINDLSRDSLDTTEVESEKDKLLQLSISDIILLK